MVTLSEIKGLLVMTSTLFGFLWLGPAGRGQQQRCGSRQREFHIIVDKSIVINSLFTGRAQPL